MSDLDDEREFYWDVSTGDWVYWATDEFCLYVEVIGRHLVLDMIWVEFVDIYDGTIERALVDLDQLTSTCLADDDEIYFVPPSWYALDDHDPNKYFH